MTANAISISGLSKRYFGSDHDALHDIGLNIKKGEIFGLLGPNGAGKTTLFSLLCGILLPTSGSITIDGFTLPEDIERIKRQFGIVPQDIALYPTLSASENLMYLGRMYGMKRDELRTKIQEYLRLFGLEDVQHRPVGQYSGGMKRSINLIGGLLHSPSILLLDEPTVGLDVQTRIDIMNYLKEFNRNQKITILYTSHYLEQAADFCDRVGIVEDGILLQTGTPKELIANHEVRSLEQVFLKLTNKKTV